MVDLDMPGNGDRSFGVDIDVVKVDEFLKARIPGLSGSPEISRTVGGLSNPTYILDYRARKLVLRRRPDGKLLPSAHAVGREYRVQKALGTSGVKVPKVLLHCTDTSIVRTEFYVMNFVEGHVFEDNQLLDAPEEWRPDMFRDASRMLARLHALDVDRAGLGNFGPRSGYFERQVRRWGQQWQLSKARDLPAIDLLLHWLPRNLPDDDTLSIVHGDYRPGNLIFRNDEPEVAAVLDWELSTLGDPMADLAHTCAYTWFMSDDDVILAGDEGPTDVPGLPSLQEFVAHYYEETSRSSELTRFHLAFALFRAAVIFEGVVDRARKGNAASPRAWRHTKTVPMLANRAADLADGRGPLV